MTPCHPMRSGTLFQRLAATLLFWLLPAASLISLPAPPAFCEPHYGGTLRIAHEIRAMGFDAIKARGFMSTGRTVPPELTGRALQRLITRHFPLNY